MKKAAVITIFILLALGVLCVLLTPDFVKVNKYFTKSCTEMMQNDPNFICE